jgi:hypothetical protein
MPFSTLPPGGAPIVLEATAGVILPEYPVHLPEPLVTAILDKPQEREGRTTAVLVYGFAYDHPASGAQILVPEGFVTDFASIPQAAQLVVTPFGRHAKAAVLHDWLYAVGEAGRKWFADQVFDDAMAELGVDAVKRRTMYEAVHLFGGGGYDRAARDWPISWADWNKGEIVPPPKGREAFYVATWAKKPSPGYGPRH